MMPRNTTAKRTILVLSLGDLFHDTRTNRIIRLLQPHYAVLATGTAKPHVPGVSFIQATPTPLDWKGKLTSLINLVTRRYEPYSWRRTVIHDLHRKLTTFRPDLILVCDVEALPLGVKMGREWGVAVLCDVPDYPPQRIPTTLNEAMLHPSTYWHYLCSTYLPQTNGVITSSQGLARLYEQTIGITPHVFPNTPDYVNIPPTLRSDDEPRIRLVVRGEAIPSDRREHHLLLRLPALLDQRFELDMLMTTNLRPHREYGKQLTQRAERTDRVRIHHTPALQLLFLVTRHHDLALWLKYPRNDNQRFQLPEMVFDAIQARLGVVTTPQQPEVANLIQRHACGVVSEEETLQSLARTLMRLDHRVINQFKCQADAHARVLSIASTRDTFLALVEQAMQ